MNRMDFIRLGAGASVVTLVGTLPGFGAVAADPLDLWARRHRASVATGEAGRNLVANPKLRDVGVALRELDELADGPMRCEGNQVRGTIRGQGFLVRLEAVS